MKGESAAGVRVTFVFTPAAMPAGKELLRGPQSDRTRALIESALEPSIDDALGAFRPAVRVAVGHREYEDIRHAFATEPINRMMEPLSDPEFSKEQSATMRKLITERMKEMSPKDFGDMLRTATREDEWLLLLHGAVRAPRAGAKVAPGQCLGLSPTGEASGPGEKTQSRHHLRVPCAAAGGRAPAQDG